MDAAVPPDVSPAEDVVVVDNLVKRFGDHPAVDGISFRVRRGEIFGLLGANGAGKTTTIEILEGYQPRTSGTVSVLGLDPDGATRAWRRRIGLVLQESELDPMHTVEETVALFARLYPDARPVGETVALVGLADRLADRVGRLSGGQRRRVDVALGIVGRPELLFLDEPTTGFDPAARREFWAMLEGLRSMGTSMILTTHYMDEAQHLADRSLILRSGRVVAEGTLDDLAAGLGGTVVRFLLPGGCTAEELQAAAGRPVTVVAGRVELVAGHDAQGVLGRLLGWASAHDVRLDELEAVRPSLDDVFLELNPGDRPVDG